MICPKCKENLAHRSERIGLVDNTLNRVLIKPYSCGGCKHRFYALRRDLTWSAVREQLARDLHTFRQDRKARRRRREFMIYAFAGLVFAAVIYYMTQMRG